MSFLGKALFFKLVFPEKSLFKNCFSGEIVHNLCQVSEKVDLSFIYFNFITGGLRNIMRYLGSKVRLLTCIQSVIDKYNIQGENVEK